MVPLPCWNKEITFNTKDSTGLAGIDLSKCSMFLLIMTLLLLWVLTTAFPPNSSKCFIICNFIVITALEIRLFLDGETLKKVKLLNQNQVKLTKLE